MSWIGDTVKQLILEYGATGSITHTTSVPNFETGVPVVTNASMSVPMIMLPRNNSQQFTRMLNPQRGGYLQEGEAEILLDSRDLTGDVVLNDLVTFKGKQYKITSEPEEYEEARIYRVHD